ncbi:MAG: PQQ-binding-like beta-propeller repeat protein, partial [Planctomycetota bacterium]|nr:PQQ-binding-like beta-propeller repeat protein [Planctomycetota bacterium]
AVDKSTGENLWRKSRALPCVGEATDSYSTPILVRHDGRTELVVAGADHVNAYDPRSGEQLWISAGLQIEHKYGRTIASPTWGDGYVVAPSSNFDNLGRTIALRVGGRGEITETHRAWTYDKASPDCPTPLIYQGYVYLVRDDGVGTCIELKTGRVLWTKRLLRGDTKASPIAGDGKVYFFGIKGACVVLRAGPEGEVVAQGDVDGSGLIATPAISGGRLWIRTKAKLHAIGGS